MLSQQASTINLSPRQPDPSQGNAALSQVSLNVAGTRQLLQPQCQPQLQAQSTARRHTELITRGNRTRDRTAVLRNCTKPTHSQLRSPVFPVPAKQATRGPIERVSLLKQATQEKWPSNHLLTMRRRQQRVPIKFEQIGPWASIRLSECLFGSGSSRAPARPTLYRPHAEFRKASHLLPTERELRTGPDRPPDNRQRPSRRQVTCQPLKEEQATTLQRASSELETLCHHESSMLAKGSAKNREKRTVNQLPKTHNVRHLTRSDSQQLLHPPMLPTSRPSHHRPQIRKILRPTQQRQPTFQQTSQLSLLRIRSSPELTRVHPRPLMHSYQRQAHLPTLHPLTDGNADNEEGQNRPREKGNLSFQKSDALPYFICKRRDRGNLLPLPPTRAKLIRTANNRTRQRATSNQYLSQGHRACRPKVREKQCPVPQATSKNSHRPLM